MLARAMLLLLALAIATGASACTRQVDIKQTFRIVDLGGGWYDAGIVGGKNKLIPTVTFRIEKTIDDPVRPLSVNVLFRQLKGQTEEDWDEVFLQRVEFTDGNRTSPLVVRPEAGATGEPPQTRAEMLKNSHFVDIRAVIFVKQSSANWVELARQDIPRQILAH
jgi:hypothetical protein